MRRQLSQFSDRVFDVIVVGAGIYGACTAWEASLRGLSVALVDQGDFGAATSANSLKIIHGGLRYLQQADFKRMRESIGERTTLMRIAPHLVHPLPILLPTYGHGLKSKEVFAIALLVNDLISFDRNCLSDSQKQIPPGKVISKQACQELLPNIAKKGLTGGAIFYDAQVYNSERLTLSFIHSAVSQGAVVANYLQVTDLLTAQNRVTGVRVKDNLTGDSLDIQSKAVINTAGGWANKIINLGNKLSTPVSLAKAMNFVLRRPLFSKYAVGIDSRYQSSNSDNLLNKGNRLFFVAPWRETSIIGTYYSLCGENPKTWQITPEEINQFLQQINQAYPPAKLKREDIAWIHQGVLPRKGINPKNEPILAKKSQIREDLPGLISAIGVKYTTARNVAEKVIDFLFKSWNKSSPQSLSSTTTLHGGEIDDFAGFLTTAKKKHSYLSPKIIESLVYNYGSVYPKVLDYIENATTAREVLKAEIIYGIREEMAQKLSDIVLRRTELGSAGYPDKETLQFCAEVMGNELNWNQDRIEQEMENLLQQ